MSRTTIRLEELVGSLVRDRDGNEIGRIFDMRGEPRDSGIVIVEYFLSAGALMTRVGMSVRSLFGLQLKELIRVPWNELDLSEPDNPVYVGERRLGSDQ